MTEYIINIKIKRMEEESKVYYLATSDDIQGLVVQADTIHKAIEYAEDAIKNLIELAIEDGDPLPIKTKPKSITNISSSIAIPVTA